MFIKSYMSFFFQGHKLKYNKVFYNILQGWAWTQWTPYKLAYPIYVKKKKETKRRKKRKRTGTTLLKPTKSV
jgi:hypothetical protein